MTLHAVVFDMDGVLIETEPVWRAAEIAIFGRLGLHLTEEQCLETMGVRVREVVEIWYRRHPWTGPDVAEVTRQIEDYVINWVRRDGEPMPGVHEAVDLVRSQGLTMAIASSSSLRLITAVVEQLGLATAIRVLCSGDDEEAGKPDPAVYLSAARALGLPPGDCLAIEDSPNGVLAAKGAGMHCIALPDPLLAGDTRFTAADLRLDSLVQLTPDVLATINAAMSNRQMGGSGRTP